MPSPHAIISLAYSKLIYYVRQPRALHPSTNDRSFFRGSSLLVRDGKLNLFWKIFIRYRSIRTIISFGPYFPAEGPTTDKIRGIGVVPERNDKRFIEIVDETTLIIIMIIKCLYVVYLLNSSERSHAFYGSY